MRTLRALQGQLRASWMVALQYRASFLGEAVVAFGWIAWTVVPLWFIFRFRGPGEDVAGWTSDEALLVLGFFVALEGVLDAFVDPNLRAVVEHVRQGTLDFVLLKPVDTQLLVSFHRTAPTKLPHVLAGLGLVALGATRLPEAPHPTDIATAALLFVAAVALLHALWTVVVSTSFWWVRVDNLSYLIRTTLDAGRWPVAFYRGAIRIVLTFVLPVGIMTTWPALALRGALEPGGAVLALGVAAAFLAGARLVWTFAIGHYTSASS